MTFAELIKEVEAAPLISGSSAIGWLVKRPDGKKISLPAGTPYNEAVKAGTAKN